MSEITAIATLNLENVNDVWKSNGGRALTLDIAQSAAGRFSTVLSISTGETNPTLTDISVNGWCYMRNLDITNFVEWGFATGVYGGRMEAGEFAEFRLNPGASLFLSADTAACEVEIVVFED